MNNKCPQWLSIIKRVQMFLLGYILYIALYGSALMIAINNSIYGIVIYFITSHAISAVIVKDMMVSIKNKMIIAEETTILRLIMRLSLTASAIMVLVFREHWYLALVTLVFTGISVKMYWRRKK